ncbi:MAG: hypothetical protein JKY26_13825 [Pseudomonas sp.]|nr:hypothetical protein [Pseudomonas sp.]
MTNNESRPLIRKHIELDEVLRLATPDELVAIADILLDKANDRILGGDTARQNLARCREEGELYRAVSDIELEIRTLGSNGIASFVRRGQPVSYDEIVRDVAKGLKVDFNKGERTADIEQKLLQVLAARMAEEAEQEASNDEPEALGDASPILASLKGGSIFGVLGKLGVSVAGGVFAKGAMGVALVGAGALAALPVTALAAYGAYSMASRNKARPELQSLTMIVVQIARIRSGVATEDHEEFASKLRECL